jgi:hypothetical protein
MVGITSRSACDSATYSASIALRANSVCNLELQMIGQLAYMITYPERLLAVSGSYSAISLSHTPANDTSA